MTQTQITNGARYWLGSACGYGYVWGVDANGSLIYDDSFSFANYYGVRPVIVVNTSDIQSS